MYLRTTVFRTKEKLQQCTMNRGKDDRFRSTSTVKLKPYMPMLNGTCMFCNPSNNFFHTIIIIIHPIIGLLGVVTINSLEASVYTPTHTSCLGGMPNWQDQPLIMIH